MGPFVRCTAREVVLQFSHVIWLRRSYNVIGVHMRNWDTADEIGEAACPDSDDLRCVVTDRC